ncbi:MAG: hypothetical protein HZA58_05775 [Acidimicrobiia bacterium]|nr:hypothetical protein [Acidimicrobiia bacterium]
MRRVLLVLYAFSLLVAACGDGSADTTAPVDTTGTTSVPTTTATSTTTATTTTLPLAPVTEHPGLPDALSRSLLHLDEIDQGWVAVLYSATSDETLAETPDGPVVLYLVSPEGDRYEIAAFPPESPQPYALGGLANDGSRVVGAIWTATGFDPGTTVVSVDTASGVVSDIVTFGSGVRLGTTLPTGRDTVVAHSTFEPTDEYLQVYRTDGSVFSEIATKGNDWPTYSWLYGLDGTQLIVGDGTSLRVMSNDGTLVRSLDTPAAMCDPVRWWDEDTILASCVPDAWFADGGYYHVLWLIPFDGSAPTRLTADPDPELDVVEFGFADAWRVGGRTLLQWWGDCGARGIHVLQPDGTGEWLDLAVDGGPWVHAQAGDDLVVHATYDCGDMFGPVHLIGPDGTLVRTLVPQIEGYRGPIAVAGMIPTP